MSYSALSFNVADITSVSESECMCADWKPQSEEQQQQAL